jgi:hypothetical protein
VATGTERERERLVAEKRPRRRKGEGKRGRVGNRLGKVFFSLDKGKEVSRHVGVGPWV